MQNDMHDLYKMVLENKELSLKDKKELLDEIRKLGPGNENRWNFRYVIWALALVALSSPVIQAWWGSDDIPQGLLTISSTAVGALAAFITSGLNDK